MELSLTPLQIQAISSANGKDRFLIRMDAGKGKSLVAYSLFKLRQKDPAYQRMFVIAPKRGLDSFIRSNFYGYKVVVLDINNIGTFEDILRYEIIVVREALLLKKFSLLKEILDCCQFVVIDEIHNYRNSKGKMAANLYSLLKPFKGPRLGMTATLEWKNLEDTHGVFKLIYEPLLGSYWDFMDRYVVQVPKDIKGYSKQITPQGISKVLVPRRIMEKKGYKNTEELFTRIAPYCFTENESDFNIKYAMSFYSLTEELAREYKNTVEGLGLDSLYKFRLTSLDERDVQFETKSSAESFFSPAGDILNARAITIGTQVQYNARIYKITKISEEESIAEYIKRIVPLQKLLSESELKYRILTGEVNKGGCLIYCNFQDTLYDISERLQKDFPSRKVVSITGGEKDFNEKVKNLPPDSICVITRIATQSVDMYYQRVILYENITTPGLFKQFVGRCTRQNAAYRDLEVVLIIGLNTIEQYWYERFVYLVENSSYEDLKKAIHTSLTSEQIAIIKRYSGNELSQLKRCLLWKTQDKEIFK